MIHRRYTADLRIKNRHRTETQTNHTRTRHGKKEEHEKMKFLFRTSIKWSRNRNDSVVIMTDMNDMK